MDSESSDLERSSLLQYAFFRWESAVILAMTLILVVLLPDPFRGALTVWRWWIWIVLGGLAEALIVLTTLSDPDVQARLATDRLRSRFDTEAIVDLDVRRQIAGAVDVREQMEVMLSHVARGARLRDGALRAQLQAIATDAERWIGVLYRLARRLSDYRDHSAPSLALHRDQRPIAGDIQALEERLARTADPEARRQLEQEIDEKQTLLGELERLDELIERAASQLATSHSALETVYTQMQLVAARGVDSRRVQQLREEVAGTVRSLSQLEQEIAERYERVLERA